MITIFVVFIDQLIDYPINRASLSFFSYCDGVYEVQLILPVCLMVMLDLDWPQSPVTKYFSYNPV